MLITFFPEDNEKNLVSIKLKSSKSNIESCTMLSVTKKLLLAKLPLKTCM